MARKPKKQRQSQEERRLKTQSAIMEASIQILVEDGYARFSASGVAACAGISRGAQEHYYPKKNDLIEAVTKYVMSEAVEHAQRLADEISPEDDPVEKFLMDSDHFFSLPSFRAMAEIMIAARADAALAETVYPIIQQARKALDNIWTNTLGAAGYSRNNALEFIELTHFFLRGLFFVETWLPYRVDHGSTLDAWRKIAPLVLRLQRSEPIKSGEAYPPVRGLVHIGHSGPMRKTAATKRKSSGRSR